MYFEDEMTPKERMTAFSKGEPMDRLPVVPDMGVTMAWYIGKKDKRLLHIIGCNYRD